MSPSERPNSLIISSFLSFVIVSHEPAIVKENGGATLKKQTKKPQENHPTEQAPDLLETAFGRSGIPCEYRIRRILQKRPDPVENPFFPKAPKRCD